MKPNKLKFIVVTSLVLSGVIYLQQQSTLQEQRFENLHTQINELTRLYDETARDLGEAYEKNRELSEDLSEAVLKIEQIEQRNIELEQILFNQRQTYRNAVAMQGSTMPVLSHSSFTDKMYERAWSSLRAYGLTGTGAAMVAAEKSYGVNSLVIASIAYLESGGGMSKIAVEKNNLFGLGAGGGNPYANAIYFDKKEDSIYFLANLLRTSYLSRDGRHYRGDNLVAVGIRYAEDPLWAVKVGRTMSLIALRAIPEGR